MNSMPWSYYAILYMLLITSRRLYYSTKSWYFVSDSTLLWYYHQYHHCTVASTVFLCKGGFFLSNASVFVSFRFYCDYCDTYLTHDSVRLPLFLESNGNLTCLIWHYYLWKCSLFVCLISVAISQKDTLQRTKT